MNIISLLASVQAPNGLWSVLINSFHSGIGNFGWTIFLVTLLVKLVTSPLDFWTKLDFVWKIFHQKDSNRKQ